MAIGTPGVDSCARVTSTMISNAYAQFNGRYPVFWARYFTDYTTGSNCEYSFSAESTLLRNAGIKVLPIARQTLKVGGTQATGYADGVKNVNDLIQTFGASKLQSSGVFFFLDVEMGTPLSAEYYLGWAQGIMSTSSNVTPCVYCSQADQATFRSIAYALNSYGMGCNGLWIASYLGTGCYGFPDWDTHAAMHTPSYPVSAPVFAWQYCNECNGMDLDEISPYASLVPYLITP